MKVRSYRPAGDGDALSLLLDVCRSAGDQDPLSEGKRLAMGRLGRGIVAIESGAVVGFAQLVPYVGHPHPPGTRPHRHPEARWEAEFVLHPAHRDRGATAMAGATVAAAPPDAPLEVWASEGYQRAGLGALGWVRNRVLHRMEVSPVPDEPPEPPAGMTISPFVPGRDEDAFLAANHEVFAQHPEQSSWDRAALDVRLRQRWFDPGGFFLARLAGGGLAGFCWTKVHDGDRPIGEIFLIGVTPTERGTGLGRALTAAGLRHLAVDRGMGRAMLYVDGANLTALTMYETMGFAVAATREVYRRWDR